MPISSMTGYARTEGAEGNCRWTWDVRSVNGKGLDIRTRLPAGFEGLDPQIKKRASARLRRGNVSVTLQLTRDAGGLRAAINEDLLESVLSLRDSLGSRISDAPPSLESLLSVRGLVDMIEEEESPETRAAVETQILKSFDDAVARLAAARADEGRRTEDMLETLLSEIDTLVASARGLAALQPDSIREKLRSQVAELLEASPTLPEDRLMQEAAILATKGDIREELDRLDAHVDSGRDLLNSDEPVGRRLEFLCQELNREANTLCSKSATLDLTQIGLSLKAAIDQVREQIQNVE